MPRATNHQEAPVHDKPLVATENLKKHFTIEESLLARYLAGAKDRVVRAVDGVSIEILPGETLGLVGESGCGKSTLGRAIVGLYEPTEGDVRFQGKPLWGQGSIPKTALRRQAQIIFQNPYSSLNPRHTVRQIIGVALAARGVHPQDREAETIGLLRRVGLGADHIDRYPHQFSGGQRQRIGVARALATNPKFIVADEPLSSLDVSVQAQIINLLQELQEEYGLTYLFITHDLRVAYHMSHRIAVMYLGQVVESADTDMLYKNPLHPYTQALLSAIPSVDASRRANRILLEGTVPTPIDPPKGCRFHPRCRHRMPVCEEEAPKLVPVQTPIQTGVGQRRARRMGDESVNGSATEAVNEVVNCRINNGANDMMENVVRRTERTNINRMNAQHLVRCHLHIR
ncbi:MAG: ABC transporter ATP-binding protein [Firmicutes bacterium]|jgi:oligopeptide/dipeptide ABC transporter ATP-binding protein|nr:ABC transporter ATP-binding protein [Bacillota bacterium]